MSLLSGGQTDFFGLDIGTLGLRAVQLRGRAPKSLVTYGQVNYAEPIGTGDAAADKQAIGQALQQLLSQTGINTKNVAVNLPSQRVFTTLIDVDKLQDNDLSKSLRYQAGAFIPTPLDKSKVDWIVLGPSVVDPKKVEVLISSVPNEYVEAKLELVESAGLNVIAMEPDSLPLTRSLVQTGSKEPQIILDIGYLSSDLLIVVDGAPRLARSIPTATSAMIRAASQSLEIDTKQAEQFIFKFGLSPTKMEGRIYNAVIGSIESLLAELDKSIKFFQERYVKSKIDKVIVSGAASIIPDFPVQIANHTKLNVEIGSAWRNVNVPPARQNELAANSNHFSIAAGLAEREA